MSLFASSFDGSAQAGPSKPTSNAPSKVPKRKRPSTGSVNEDQLKGMQRNLEKLMGKDERGNLPGTSKGDGQEAMGAGVSKKKGKEPVRQYEEDERPRGDKKGGGHDNKRSKHNTPQAGKNGSKQNASSTPKSTSKAKEQKNEPHTPQTKSGKPTPAELPMPHVITPKSSNGEDEANLTSLQKGMKSKLEGARFRWINEQLYSNPSTEAVAMMKKDPKVFSDYHMTHRALTSAWPSPPLPHIVKLLTPLPPRTTIVDLGCGDAGLARALVPQGKIVLSYDLVGDAGVPSEGSSGGWVVETDFLEVVPLPGRPGGLHAEVDEVEDPQPEKKNKGSKKGEVGDVDACEVVDVVVCCLSLMGTNWVGGIYEACRILRQGGIFHVAEVTSRFISTETFTSKIESFGFELEAEESPSTHFTLFRFKKVSTVPLGPARGEAGWKERLAEGEQILRGCVYRKR